MRGRCYHTTVAVAQQTGEGSPAAQVEPFYFDRNAITHTANVPGLIIGGGGDVAPSTVRILLASGSDMVLLCGGLLEWLGEIRGSWARLSARFDERGQDLQTW